MPSLKQPNTQVKHKKGLKSGQLPICPRPPLTCHVEGALLGGGDGAVPAPQQRTAPPLAHLLLQPGAQLQVGLRG